MKILIENIGKSQDEYLLNVKKGYEIWCCEHNLGNVLKEIFPNQEIIRNKKIEVKNKKFIPDYRINDKKLIIEFQGFQHFTNSKIVYLN